LFIERIEVFRSEFERRRDMQQVRSAGSQASRGLSGQLAGPFKDLLWKRVDFGCGKPSGTLRS
jgi:hypothetical protein